MADPFLGEIRMFSGNFAPRGYAWCDGSLVTISEFPALFAILGTRYGGDGRTNFALPDLRGRLPVGCGDVYYLGLARGQEFVQLTQNNLPPHNHGVTEQTVASIQATTKKGGKAVPTSNSRLAAGWSSTFNLDLENYLNSGATEDVSLGGIDASVTSVLSSSGASQKHHNIQPCLSMMYIIAVQGTFPPRAN
ncbi:phage tail protein [Desulfoluna butyratoxydans]|uniref:Phage tail collar domain n=1 Tax=Desulfoluna butyratoxydans TaxID=231438 RepID=A0A4U8YQH6_9BACT|nr:tail fiber protein [Desulfoluna butyratoxydans]VFQ46101.1 phage tail collar domain [Desulfoluna butyratoxydans]